MASLFDYAAVGLLQGIFEWLPVSSKTIVFLYALYVSGSGLLESYVLGLAVQAGCVLSAVLYYRELLFTRRDLFVFKFVLVASLSTAVTGLPLYLLLLDFFESAVNPGLVTLLVGSLLLSLGFLQRMLNKDTGHRREVKLSDAVYMGLAQGLAVLPGVSRSGVTILALLARGCSTEDSFKYSFVSSIPANLGALVLVAVTESDVLTRRLDVLGLAVALTLSAVAGYLVIDLLLKAARRHSWRTTLVVASLTIIIGILTLIPP